MLLPTGSGLVGAGALLAFWATSPSPPPGQVHQTSCPPAQMPHWGPSTGTQDSAVGAATLGTRLRPWIALSL